MAWDEGERHGRDFAPVKGPTQTERLAERIRSYSLDQVPERAVQKMKEHLAHHLGLALSARDHPSVSIARRVAAAVGSGGPATVVGERESLSPIDAAFVNASMMRAHRLDDVLFPAGVHIGLMTIPTALALAEQESSSGRVVLEAMLAGYDVVGALGSSVQPWASVAPRRPTIVFGTFGGAATASRVLNLSAHETAHALGYAANMAMGVSVGEFPTNYYGYLARNCLMAAEAVRAGGSSSLEALEGPFGFWDSFFGGTPPGVTDGIDAMGSVPQIMNTTLKFYPGTGLNIVPVEMMRRMRESEEIGPDDVSRVVLALPEERRNFGSGHAAPPFGSEVAAVGSSVFLCALVLAGGDPAEASARAAHWEELADVMALFTTTLESGRPFRYARLEVTLRNGKRLLEEAADHVFPATDWSSWLEESAGGLLPKSGVERLVRLIGDLEQLDDIHELMETLRPA